MRYQVALILWLISSPTIALPSITDINVLGAAASGTEYEKAAISIQRAILIQTGIERQIKHLESELANSWLSTLKGLETDVSRFIDESTPLSSRSVFFLGAISYAMLFDKTISHRFKNPWLDGVEHVVIAGKQYQYLGVKIKF